MGRRSRRKGADWERRVASILREVVGEGVHRGYQRRGGGSAPGEGCDVEGTPFWIEAKHGRVTNPRAALRQAREKQAECSDARPAVAVCKDDRPPPGWRVGLPLEPPVAVMDLAQWVALVSDWVRLKRAAGEPVEVPQPNGGVR